MYELEGDKSVAEPCGAKVLSVSGVSSVVGGVGSAAAMASCGESGEKGGIKSMRVGASESPKFPYFGHLLTPSSTLALLFVIFPPPECFWAPYFHQKLPPGDFLLDFHTQEM